MIRHARSLALLLTTLLTLGAAAPASAQSPTDILHFLEGLESAYARRYDSPANHIGLGIATPTGFDAEAVPNRVEATVLTFAEETDARAAFVLLDSDFVIPLLVHDEGVTSGDFADAGLGDTSLIYVGEEMDSGEVDGALFVRDGALGFIVTAEGAPAAVETALRAFGAFMVEAEPGPGEVIYGDVADSHGGAFDVLPAVADREVLNGLIPMYDYNLLESNSPIEAPATPAA